MIKTIFVVSTLSIFSLLSINMAQAADVYGKITKVKGEGFISYKGKTIALKAGDNVLQGSEIVIEHEGAVTFKAFNDQTIHLGKASSMMIDKDALVLRQGEVWFQAPDKSKTIKLSTANADVVYNGGEGILVYDSEKAKSQIFVMNGMMKVNNARTPEVAITVGEGNFSYVDNTYDQGIPRDPTPVGEKTYKELLTHFPNVLPMQKGTEQVFETSPARVVSSAEETEHRHTAHGEKVAKKPEGDQLKEADDILTEYRDQLFKKASPAKNSKMKRSIASVSGEKSKTKLEKKPAVKIFGGKGEKTMTFGEEFTPSSVESKSLRGPASFSAPEYAPTKAGEIEKLEEHNNETKKLIEDLGKL